MRSGAPTVLTSAVDGDRAATFALNDVSSGKSFHSEAEGLRNRWWVGSKDGWLVTMDAGFDVELLNPATDDGVRPPSFTTIPRATIDRGRRALRRAEVRLPFPTGGTVPDAGAPERLPGLRNVQLFAGVHGGRR